MSVNDHEGIQIGRAGNYARQIGGYKAFVPQPLPPNPPVQLDNELI